MEREGTCRPVVAVKRRATVALVAMALTMIAPVSGPAAESSAPVSLGNCDMMVTATLDTAERLRPFLPPGYRIGANLFSTGTREVGVLTFWVFSCDAVEIPARATQPVRFAFSAIAIETDERPTAVTTTPRNFDHYNVFAHTENADFAAWLDANNVPTKLVERITVKRGVVDEIDTASGQRSVTIAVPAIETGYAMTTHPRHPDVVGRIHDHANTFWHEASPGAAGVFRLFIRNATDTACYLLAPCGEIRAEPGTPSAELLGDARRPVHMAFDHLRLGEVTALVNAGATPS